MRIIITNQVLEKVMYWVDKASFEVSGFGKIEVTPNGDFRVIEAYLLPQEGGPAHTDIDAEGLGKLMHRTYQHPGHLNWWWHSHVDMQAFWSGQDKETISGLGANGLCVATVFNKRREMKSAHAARYTGPLGETQIFELWDIPTVIEYPVVLDRDAWDAEFKENVREVVRQPFNILGGSQFNEKTWEATQAYYDDMYDYKGEKGVHAYYHEGEIEFYASLVNMTPAAFAAVYNTGDNRAIKKMESKVDAAYSRHQKKLKAGGK